MHSIPLETYVIFVNSNTSTNEGLDCIESTNIMGNFCKFEHLNKWKFSSAFNWLIDVSNSCKLEHPHKLRFYGALNWPIDVCNSCKPEKSFKWRF
jgi:hypothetical protein